MTVGDFHYISKLVRDRAAIVLEPGKEYLIESRLLPLVRERGHDSITDLVADLQRAPHAALRDEVVEAMTTNETSFFRDGAPFQALTERVLPELIRARAAERSLNIWSAACSSGQEVYSIAMTVRDVLAADPHWRVRLLATDLSQQMLTRTREGCYSQLEVNRGLPAAALVRHFRRDGLSWRISDDLRQMIDTRSLNLAEEWPVLPSMDVVFLRNVLIYFDTEVKRQILARVRRVLRPDGFLFLGGAETTLNLDDSFERLQIGRATAYRLRDGKASA
ncbi:MAG: protein-glutamate O-methyltransferase CheR [Nocardioidaceae bacterium]|nr:protein-glutamate O-methyltransferase CheR [Nocardioidaceae bacterium]